MHLYSNTAEEKYLLVSDNEIRKKSGQFFTPFRIAEFMSEWLLQHKNKNLRILDPAAGLGIFPRALLFRNSAYAKQLSFTLFENENNAFSRLKEIIKELNVKTEVLNQDFLKADISEKYDGIIANPPYYKHNHLKNKQELHGLICRETGFNFSIQSNIYCWFMIKSLNMLKPGGRVAFIVPSEFLNANYGEKIKEYLLAGQFSLHLINIDSQVNVFSNAVTTAVIILAEKNILPEVNYYNIHDISSLEDSNFFCSYLTKKMAASELLPEKKWRIYFTTTSGHQSRNLIPLSSVGTFSRGIATGANNYFVLSASNAHKYNLPESCLISCISKAEQARDILFDNSNFEQLVNDEKKVFLFNAENGNDNEACQHYIALGKQQLINHRYLTRKRTPWYSLEKRSVSRIWAPVFNRKKLRFIWNSTECLTLTCFHCFYPAAGAEKWLDILFIYLNTEIATQLFEAEKREYGNGLDKFEPNDLNKTLIIDFSIISPEDITELEYLQSMFIKAAPEKRNRFLAGAEKIFEKYIW